MKLQPASRKEIKRMSIGCVICAVIQLTGFFLLHLMGVIPFTYRVVLGTLGGTGIAIFSFVILCLAVQKAVDSENDKAMKARMQMSYNIRLLLQAGWVVAAFLLPWFQVLAAAAPLLYPTVIIMYLQSRGKLVEASERSNPGSDESDDDSDDHLESFEV